ncbi:VCBS repeat-containing protein [Streptomyces sp. NBC_00572]|uniref:FG-GAP repeat domain-containing protein n=1 Tax=Streptomyces sp. NBC_00572 TaxID=2903664 RepID=UPI0022585D02|nr:VCBS repeat-containing protein [Streptomyces sp. NBC_00572]MCX4981819.1 VCBS repeat-containing protein [Streptomyces sp. NBC_00572]
MQFRSTGTRSTRLAAAVTAVLAVTALGAGTLATAPTAFAAAQAPAQDGQAADLPVVPTAARVTGTGTTGFLTYGSADQEAGSGLLWTPFAGGEPTPLQSPDGGGWAMSGSDVVVLGDTGFMARARSLTLRNMAAPTAPGVEIDLGALNGNYVTVLSPTSVLAQVTNEDGTAELHVVTKDGTATSSRKISGLPADADHFFTSAAVQDGIALIGYETGPAGARTGGRALIDTAAGTVSETYASAGSGYGTSALMLSRSHVAWQESESGTGRYAVSVDRSTRQVKRTFLGADDEYSTQLVGGWLVYGNAWRPGKAVPLTGGETIDIAEKVTGSAGAGDGSAVISGRRTADGSGLFRIVASESGAPSVTKVADMTEALNIEQVHIPDSVNLDQTGGEVTLGWTLSRPDAHLDVSLHHIASGKEFHTRVQAPATGTRFSFTWDGRIDGVDAPNGRYAVSAEATPLDGVGEPAFQGWLFTARRTFNAHDYTNNGSTDVLARDAAGVLWRDDLRDRSADGHIETSGRTRIGSGWNTYKQIEAVGDLEGNQVADLIALDGSGVLWHYLGKGDGTFATRVKVGGGWGVYNQLTGGSDLDGDGRSDLLATDASGVLWFYKGTGDAAKPFATRVKVGGGWGVYNQLTAVGDIAGTAAGDLVARDTAGVLWLYQGDGRGNFATRVRVGGGWGAFSQLVGAGDVDNDGRPDLIAYGTGGTYVYRSTGSAITPFSRRTTDLYAGEGTTFNSVA